MKNQLAKRKERPILFSPEMVSDILEGKKTQTRRVVKPQPEKNEGGFWELGGAGWNSDTIPLRPIPGHSLWNRMPCQPGDMLWVRESHWIDRRDKSLIVFEDGITAARNLHQDHGKTIADFEELKRNRFWSRVPSMFMPRWASRLFLAVEDVHMERLQTISEFDAIAEGCFPEFSDTGVTEAVEMYRILWDKLNAKRSFGWDANPWVWKIEFSVLDETKGETEE